MLSKDFSSRSIQYKIMKALKYPVISCYSHSCSRGSDQPWAELEALGTSLGTSPLKPEQRVWRRNCDF